MGAILGGTMRSPFTGIVFAIELTHDLNMMLPLMIAVTIAHAFTVSIQLIRSKSCSFVKWFARTSLRCRRR